MKYKEHEKYQKELRRLKKKYPSLDKDVNTLKKYSIELFHGDESLGRGIYLVSDVQLEQADWRIFKVKKFACRSLKGSASNSGMRLIYAHNKMNGEIILLEIYYKQDKENMDYNRCKKFLENIVED